MSISWGVKERFKFESAGQLYSWQPLSVAAVYAVTFKGDPEKPKAHTILYVGHAKDLQQEMPEQTRQVRDAWEEGGHDVRDLNVFVHVMPGSGNGERAAVMEQLVSEYRPRCNR
jgi:hypothetical protein